MGLVYLVDDNFDIVYSVSQWLQLRRYEVRSFSSSIPLFEGMELEMPDAILLDINLNGEDGRDVCREIRKRHNHRVPVILFSAMYDTIKQVKDNCADDFMPKGASLTKLADMLKEHIKIETE